MSKLTAGLGRLALAVCLAVGTGAWAPPADPAPTTVGPTPESPELPRGLQLAMAVRPLTANGDPGGRPPQAQALYLPWSRVIYQSVREDAWEIFLSNDDGTGLVRLTTHPANDIHPRLTRGVDRFAFASDRTGNFEIFTANADGNGLAQLTAHGSDDVSPYWSPDASRIAFQSYRDGQAEVYVMNSDGSNVTRLTDSPNFDGQPAWSPDGTKIAFTAYRNGQWRIWMMDANGANQVQVSDQPYSEDPVWSPDGTRIMFDADSDSNGWTELWFINADGSNAVKGHEPGYAADAYAGSWAPSGQQVAFAYVNFQQFSGQWYWTSAHICYAYPDQYGTAGCMPGSNTEWNPDWQNTDAFAPVSAAIPLPAASPLNFTVYWSGTDVGSGLLDYDIQMRVGANGAWQDLYNNVTFTSYAINGQPGESYYFRVRARDLAGNLEAWPATYDTMTSIETLPPVTSIGALPPYSRQPFTVTWSGSDPGGSGIEVYSIEFYDNVTATWSQWLSSVGNSEQFSGATAGRTYSFRSNARDRAGNLEAWPASADAQTTVYDWAANLTARDNRGTPIGGATLGLAPNPLFVAPSDVDGRFTAYAGLNGTPMTYTASWSKTGYGPLPNGLVRTTEARPQDIVLPPADDVIANGGFETGALGPAWATSGAAPAVVTGTLSHTGGYSALAGTAGLFTAPQTLQSEQAYGVRLLQTSDGVLHAAWITQTVPAQAVVYASRSADGVWSAPVVMSGTMGYTSNFDLGADAAGNVHLVWTSYDGTALYGHRAPNGTWDPAIAISTGSINGWLTVAIDGAGTAHVAWLSPAGDYIYRNRSAAGVWASAEIAAPAPSSNNSARLAVTPSGTVVAAWSAVFDGQLVVYVRQRSGGTWSAPAHIPNSVNPQALSLAVTNAGAALVAWSQNAAELKFTTCSAGSCAAVQTVAATNPILIEQVLGPDGSVHLLWIGSAPSNQQALYARRSPAGVWGSVEKVADLLIAGTPAQLAVSANGTLHAAWMDGLGGPRLMYAQRPVQGGWSWPEEIMSQYSYNWRLTADQPSGGAHLLWNASPSPAVWQLNYQGPVVVSQTAASSLSQHLTIPVSMTAPTLSFLYQAGGLTPSRPFSVSVDAGSGPATVFSTTERTTVWTHHWVDLSAWSGQSVTVTFGVQAAAGQASAYAYVDEVSLGAARPDTWVTLAGTPSGVAGDLVTYTLSYGNRGGAPANALALSLALDSHLQFVSASPAASVAGQTLSWTTGSLPAGSSAGPITVTVRVLTGSPILSLLTSHAQLAAPPAELETGNNLAAIATQILRRLFLPNVFRN